MAEATALRQQFSPSLINVHLDGQVPSSWNMQGIELLRWRSGRLNPEDIPGQASAVLLLADLLDA